MHLHSPASSRLERTAAADGIDAAIELVVYPAAVTVAPAEVGTDGAGAAVVAATVVENAAVPV